MQTKNIFFILNTERKVNNLLNTYSVRENILWERERERERERDLDIRYTHKAVVTQRIHTSLAFGYRLDSTFDSIFNFILK